MEEICRALSDKLKEAGERVYAVFYEDELLDVLPEDTRNRETLEAALKKLNNGGFIDVRYARGSAFCLSYIRPYEGENATESAPELPESEQKISAAVPIKMYIAMAACSFFGGLLGGLCALLGAVV